MPERPDWMNLAAVAAYFVRGLNCCIGDAEEWANGLQHVVNTGVHPDAEPWAAARQRVANLAAQLSAIQEQIDKQDAA